ncbi:MAG TPA: DUF1127 domain-containing protein [Dongiaceae bacterium]|nr:DUF1127 domain-containing protein [Dongiaceae bacterium]
MSTKTWIATSRNVPSRRQGALAAFVAGLWRTLRDARARALQRRHLVALSDHQLRDIGLSRSDVELEWKKPFWRG